MIRRTMAAGLVLGVGLAMVPTPAHGSRLDNFRPAAGLDTSQVLTPDDAALETMAIAADQMSWRATWIRWPDGAVTWIETES